jgi:hypothetical protein
MFKPKIYELVLQHEGETNTVYIKSASQRERLRMADLMKKTKNNDEATLAVIVKQMVVNKDGAPLDDKSVDEIIDMDSSPFDVLQKAIFERLGVKTDTEKEKNA